MVNQLNYFVYESHQYGSRTNFSSLRCYFDQHFYLNASHDVTFFIFCEENLVLKQSIYLSKSSMKYLQTIDVQVIQLPCNIMDSSKYIKLSIMKSYSMAVSYSGNFSLIFQPCEFIVSEAKTPQIIESIALILSSKNINILIISSDG